MATVNKIRVRRITDYMQEDGISQVVLCSAASLLYLIGVAPLAGERLQVLYLNENGDVTLITSEVGAAGVGQLEGGSVVAVKDGEDGVSILASRLIPGKIGVDGAWPARFLLRLCQMRELEDLVVGTSCIDRARMIKDVEEQELLRQSSALNDAVMGELVGSVRLELTEGELSHLGDGLFVRHGRVGPGLPPMVCYGANCADPHHLDMGQERLRPGDFVLFDMGMPYRGYHSDMTRTVAFGKPTALQREIYQIVLEANLAGIAAARPGVRACDVDAAARNVIKRAGYGDRFIHRTGHGIGLEGHEFPDIGPASQTIIQPGMCFSIEPGIYLPGETGVRIEDLVLVTEGGCEVLNHYPKELFQL